MKKIKLTKQEILSIIYHDHFDFPLTKTDLNKWRVEKKIAAKINISEKIVTNKDYYYLKSREKILYLRAKREKYSSYKLRLAKKFTKVFKIIPTILFVGITGSLSMGNTKAGSDIDLMIICKNESLWLSRALVYMALILFNIPFRRFNDKNEKDKLCLNIWLEEGSLVWDKMDRNLFTSHEILQVIPLINKRRIFETFLWSNKWVRNYWEGDMLKKPILNHNVLIIYKKKLGRLLRFPFNRSLYLLQHIKMRRKMTNETINIDHALFHPNKNSGWQQ